MKKNGRTLNQDISIIRRGLDAFDKILPNQMRHVYIRCILAAIIPFITNAVSAFIIDALLDGQTKVNMLIICFTGVSLLFILALWKYYEDSKIAVGYNRLFSSHEINLTNKSYSIPYEILEKNSTKRLRDEVSSSINLSGAGMASLYWDIDVFVTNMMVSLIAFGVLIRFMYQMFLQDQHMNSGHGETVRILLIISALIFSCSLVSCKMTGKRFDVSFKLFQHGSKYSRYGEFFTMNYLQNENAALDIRIYNQEELIVSECQSKCYEQFANGKREEFSAVSKYDGIKSACSCVCGCIVYILIGQKVLQGIIGCGSIILLYTSVTMLIESLSRTAEIITDLRNNNEHLLRYFQYIDLPDEEIREQGEKKSVVGVCAGIKFQNVCFKYPESDTFVLKDICFEIRSGEKMAVVGENGSGKTTLVKLLCRLYKPTAGNILLNGKDIWDYPYEDYISLISTVFQDFSLFAFSVAENIAASQEYDKENVEASLEKVGLMEKISKLDRGIEQALFHDFDENGVDLSSGEAQKLAIARAVYKDSDIMILDEPTAALDPYAEYEIYNNFGKISKGKTVLSISHRLSSCRMCDRILVIHQGKVVQCGTHEELLENSSGKYFELWNAQAQYYFRCTI